MVSSNRVLRPFRSVVGLFGDRQQNHPLHSFEVLDGMAAGGAVVAYARLLSAPTHRCRLDLQERPEVLAAEETTNGTDIAEAFRFLNRVQKRKAVVFLISDFLDTNYEKEMRITARRHDLICCPITDPHELELPNVGLIELEDAETGELQTIDTSSKKLRNAFATQAKIDHEELLTMFRKNKVDNINFSTDTKDSYVDDIRQLFRKRQIRAKRG